jgi:hypothetical protein
MIILRCIPKQFDLLLAWLAWIVAERLVLIAPLTARACACILTAPEGRVNRKGLQEKENSNLHLSASVPPSSAQR